MRRTPPFEKSQELEFEYVLAEKLRMTVGEMRERMSGEEFAHWAVFHGRRAQREEMARLRAK